MRIAMTTTILVMTILSGCATQSRAPQRMIYEKPGVAESERQRDETECMGTASAGGRPFTGIGLLRINRDVFDQCMKSRGYSVRPAAS